MDTHVASGAVPKLRIEHVVGCGLCDDAGLLAPESARAVMALEAHGKEHGTRQQASIHRAVGHVAGFATFDVYGRMLEREGPALVTVALDAHFVVAERLVHHRRTQAHTPSRGERPVRIVAIGALHESFIHAMFDGHVE